MVKLSRQLAFMVGMILSLSTQDVLAQSAPAPTVRPPAPAAPPAVPTATGARPYGQPYGQPYAAPRAPYGQYGQYGQYQRGRVAPQPQAAPAKPSGNEEELKEAELMPQGMIQGESSTTGDRTLLGHTFHYPRFVDNAFTAANFYVGSSVELFSQSKVVSTFEAGGEEESLEYDRDLGFVRLRFGTDFQAHEVFAFGVKAEYLAEVGANEETLFLYGGQTGFDIRPHLKFRVARGTEAGAQLAIRPFAIISGGIRAVPQGLLRVLATEIEGIASDLARTRCLVEADFACAFEGGTDLGQSIQLTQRRYGGGAAINYAQALSRHLSGQFSFSVGGATSTTSATFLGDVAASHVLIQAGFSPAVNFHPVAPIGMTLEYRFELDKASYDPNETAGMPAGAEVSAIGHRGAAGLYYTGRRDLMLGWIAGIASIQDTMRSLQAAEEEPPAFVFAAQFDMRYFF